MQPRRSIIVWTTRHCTGGRSLSHDLLCRRRVTLTGTKEERKGFHAKRDGLGRLLRVAVVVEAGQVNLVDVLHVENVFQEGQVTEDILKNENIGMLV